MLKKPTLSQCLLVATFHANSQTKQPPKARESKSVPSCYFTKQPFCSCVLVFASANLIFLCEKIQKNPTHYANPQSTSSSNTILFIAQRHTLA